MINQSQKYVPGTQAQLLLEVNKQLVAQPSRKAGLTKLDAYMARQIPVMIGVDYKPGTTYNHDHTTEHFIVLVGSGIENGRKYYRFFDVGTIHRSKGTDPRNRLYYDAQTGSYAGRSWAAPEKRIYTIAQLRFH